MKKIVIIFFILGLSLALPAYSNNTEPQIISAAEQNSDKNENNASKEEPELRSIFIWQLPDDTPEQNNTNDNEEFIEDTDGDAADEDSASGDEFEEEIPLSLNDTQLKGYLEYTEDADAIFLKDEDQNLVLNLRVPQKFDTVSASNVKLPMTTFAKNVYARSGDISYNIAPINTGAVARKGNFSIGTSYNESIDTSDLGFTTSLYTKYDRKYFSVSSAYNKESGVAYSTVVDKFSFTPELKLNKYISIKDVLTSDITRNRKENSLILSIKPTQDDRVRFEFGAGQTFDENKNIIKSSVKFSTQFKW